MTEIDEVLAGSIDMHVHHGPDPLMPRRCGPVETATQAKEMGMAGLVLKSHSYPTAPLAYVVASLVPGFAVFGSLCMEHETGGINPHAVETSARLGAKVLWMPTFSAANSMAVVARFLGLPTRGEGLSVLDARGELLPAVGQVLEVVKEHQMVLASGHLAPKEVLPLMAEAQRVGVSRLVITHALERGAMEQILSLEELKALAGKGAFIEFCVWALMPTGGGMRAREIVNAIRELGAEHCIISSDFGQAHHPYPAEGMRMFIATLLRAGMSRGEVELMAKVNPAWLLGLS